jgi:dipeptidyl aminopeptidase/acylaminoacyl peptidase
MACGMGHAASPPPIEAFFRPAEFQNPKQSPDGKRIALVVSHAGERGGLAVVDMADPSRSKMIAGFSDADVNRIRWVNDHRLVYDGWDGAAELGRPIWPGIWAVDDNGENTRRLAYSSWEQPMSTGTYIHDRTLPYNWVFHSTLDDGSDNILIEGHEFNAAGEPSHVNLARLDTRTGVKRNAVEEAPSGARQWWADRMGRVIAVRVSEKDRSQLMIPDQAAWKAISQGHAFSGEGERFELLGASLPGVLFVVGADPEGKVDTEVLSKLDLSRPNVDPKVLLSLPGYDFEGVPVVDPKAGKLLGIQYETDAEGTAWLDAGMRSVQVEVDRQMPGTINQISCRNCLSDELLLVTSSSDRQPPIYSRYERSTKKLTPFLNSRSWIDPRQMGEREQTQYKTRDGLSIPLMITHPPGHSGGKRPTVVLVHGGPWVRGNHWADWSGHAEAQFLASRGYLVIEPEFRGSTGYGSKLFRAGFKQWGLAMQDDLIDALDFAAAKGWADPQRVCIGGASYGGYATLMGLAKTPERFRCGFEWVGVTDIDLMYSINWSDASEQWKDYGMPELIGDRVKDAAQLKATSPIQLAARITQPLLMAYGGLDRRVPIAHGEAFRKAVQANNSQVEWVEYPDEDHGWRALKTNVDFWGRVEKLLARTIGDAANH